MCENGYTVCQMIVMKGGLRRARTSGIHWLVLLWSPSRPAASSAAHVERQVQQS